MNFCELHTQPHPLILVNVWDAASAQLAERQNAVALGTSSAAMAAVLGYHDGEDMPFDTLKYMVGRIRASTTLPLTVDLEAGYSREPAEIADHIRQMIDLDVVGINLEDSLMDGNTGRTLVSPTLFARQLSQVQEQLGALRERIFWNIRTDAFLVGHPTPLDETQQRIRQYEAAGADGIFVPGLTQEDDIAAVVATTHLPINVMSLSDLPSVDQLQRLGVKRISMGNFLFSKLYGDAEQSLCRVINQSSLTALF